MGVTFQIYVIHSTKSLICVFKGSVRVRSVEGWGVLSNTFLNCIGYRAGHVPFFLC